MSSPYHQMHKRQDPSPSSLSASSHNNNNNNSSNNSRSIATSTARVLNKMNALVRPPESFLKSRPSPKVAATTSAERFQIVHTPDRAMVAIPLWEIPRTEADYKAAIKKMKTQGRLRAEGERARQTGAAAQDASPAYDQLPPYSRCVDYSADPWPKPLRRKGRAEGAGPEKTPTDTRTDYGSLTPRTAHHPGHMAAVSAPRVHSPLGLGGAGVATPASTPTSGRFPPRVMERRAASAEALRPPRPLSERALIPMGPRARRSEQTPKMTINTSSALVASPAATPSGSGGSSSSSIVEGARDGNPAVDPGNKARRRRTRRQWNIDSVVSGDGEDTDGYSRPGVSSARPTSAFEETGDRHDVGSEAAGMLGWTKCYVCQEPCKSGAGLCSECQGRFQPLEEVFEYSESEYEDDEVDSPSPSPEESPVLPATPTRSERRGGSISPHMGTEDASLRSWSGLSSTPQHSRLQQEMASRSASVSPTPHLALQLKVVVPHQKIRKVSVTSPARDSPEDRRSALYHIQQAMELREPMTPGAVPEQGRDVIRVGSVHSGEVTLVDDNGNEPGERVEGVQHQSRGSYSDWFRYYGKEEDGDGEYVFDPDDHISPITNCDLFSNSQNRASARSGTYERIYSIYNAYCDQEDDEDDGSMF